MKEEYPAIEDKAVLQYLPVIHIMGRTSLYTNYAAAAAIGIYGGDMSKLFEDINLLKPT